MVKSRLVWMGVVSISLFAFGKARGQTVINIPPGPNIGDNQSIGSNTQIFLSGGGAIGNSFDAGASSGTSSNIVVNISGGTVGDSLAAFAGSIVNVVGGSVGQGFLAFDGSEVNFTGGSIDDAFTIAGNSDVTIFGGEFRLGGSLVGGLGAFNLPVGSALTGTLADGTPFAFSSLDGDFISDGALTLVATSLPAVGPNTIALPGDSVPRGIRAGQSLQINNGGTVGGNFSAGRGSVVEVVGGQLGRNFEAVGAQVSISGGSIDSNFDALVDSVVNISGGNVGERFDASGGSVVNISGGVVDDRFNALDGSEVNITGGVVGSSFEAFAGSVVNIAGGSTGENFDALSGSEVNLLGSQFVLDGSDITGSLSTNVPLTINDRNVTLSGLLGDGSPFSFDLNSTDTSFDFFSSGATLTVTRLAPADFDFDGDVDGADFLRLQRGQSPGISGASDLDLWMAGFGTTSPNSSTSHSVPEPTTWIMLIAGMVAMGFRRDLAA